MDSTPLTFGNLVLAALLVLMIIIFGCYFLRPLTISRMRSNKEEKLGLSQNKLFHANGYMIHSGSDFLLSTSGSFKRFDSIDKDDYKQSGQHPAQNTTTPLWNLSQGDSSIPPQPLRPAPAPQATPPSVSHNKSVTFSFKKLNETAPTAHNNVTIENDFNGYDISGRTSNGVGLVSCMRSSAKMHPIPQPIDAPPPTRLSSATSAMLSTTAIPRPVAKTQMSLPNGIYTNGEKVISTEESVTNRCMARRTNSNPNSAITVRDTPNARPRTKTLTRRNSSTNPFLCESLESINETTKSSNDLAANINSNNNNGKHMYMQSLASSVDSEQHAAIAPHLRPANGNTASKHNGKNPFCNEADECTPSPDELNFVALTDEDDAASAGELHHEHALNGQNSRHPIYKTASEATSSVKQIFQSQKFRNRSFSDTETSANDLKQFSNKIAAAGLLKISNTTNPFTGLTQKVKGPHMLKKTISEDFLFRKLGMNHGTGINHHSAGNATWSFGRSLLRQDSSTSLERRNSSQCSLDSTNSSLDGINLERAISCDSVNSDSSVFLCELDQPYTQITGNLFVRLYYDKNTITAEGVELTVTVVEAKGLICPFNVESLDTFVRIYLVPDQAGAMQTDVFQNSQTPYYNESFTFWLKTQEERHSLWFHIYHNGAAHTLIGEAEMEFCEIPRPVSTWIPLSDSRKSRAQWGELMFSLSYLPTAERLTIVVVKARNLKLDIDHSTTENQEMQSVFVKVYLINNEKTVLKKRTSLKRKDRCLIFNESMIFSVPPQSLTTVQLRLTVFGVLDNTTIVPLGHVIAGSCSTGKGLRHWHQMLSSLRKPVAMWHVLRRATNQPIFTGGAEAVVAALQSSAIHAKRNSII